MAILIERKLRRRRRKQQEDCQSLSSESSPINYSNIKRVVDCSRIPSMENFVDNSMIIFSHGAQRPTSKVNRTTTTTTTTNDSSPSNHHCYSHSPPPQRLGRHHIKLPSSLNPSMPMLLLIVSVAFALLSTMNLSQANSVVTPSSSNNGQQQPSQKTRYRTVYACEDRQLTIDCDYGYKINLIRANFGRFSIATCNEQGQLDLSTDCIAPITFRIMKDRCQDNQKCSVNATTQMFGDKCPKTRKYLEVHFQCQPQDFTSLNRQPTNLQPTVGEPDRVDLRNSSAYQNYQSPTTTTGNIVASSGSSSVLPPNNPLNSYLQQQQQQTQQSSYRPSASTNNQQINSYEDTVPVQQPTLPVQRQPVQQLQQSMTVMNSDILSYNVITDLKSIYNPNNSTASGANNNEQIVVTLRHNHVENMSNPRCVLWDQVANQWTERGSQIIETNQTHTVCAFDQATSYLLVMDYLAPHQSVSYSNFANLT